MSFVAGAITIIKAISTVFTTFKLAKAAINATSTNIDKDHVDPIGNQTVDGRAAGYGLNLAVVAMKVQNIPEDPRGQFAVNWAIKLSREGNDNDPAIPVTIQVTPYWVSGGLGVLPNSSSLPFGTGEFEMPVGEASFKGASAIDGNQAFFYGGPQRFFLEFEIINPTTDPSWTMTQPPKVTLKITTEPFAVDFDYWHFKWLE